MELSELAKLMRELLTRFNKKNELYEDIDDLRKQIEKINNEIDDLAKQEQALLANYCNFNRTTAGWILNNYVRVNGKIHKVKDTSVGIVFEEISVVDIEEINK